MQTTEALKIIQALADGVDPNTGEVFPEGSAYQHPQVVRALLVAAKELERRAERDRRDKRLPKMAGEPWDEVEDKKLVQAFEAGMDISTLARQHERTHGAISARLEKLGKIAPSDRYTARRASP